MPVGNLQEFKPDVEDWSTYKTRLTSWMVINDITAADKKKASLIAVLGGEAVQLLINLCSPDRLDDQSFAQCVTLLDGHYGRRNEVAEAYVFDTRTQSATESIPEFVLALKRLSTHCNFGPSDQLKQKLRNRLVAGVRSDAIRQALIREGPTLTWDAAVTLASQMDDYQSSAMAQQSNNPTAEIKTTQSGRKGPAAQRFQVPQNSAPGLGPPATKAKYLTSKCWRCGKSNHSADQCRFRDATCHNCGRLGHIKPMCTRKRAQTNSTQANAAHAADHVEAEQMCSDFDNVSLAQTLRAANSHNSNPYCVTVSVNGVDLVMEIDTGATVSLIPYDVYQKHFSNAKLTPSGMQFCSFTGDMVMSEGKFLVSVKHFGRARQLWLHVLRASRFTLLGRDWLKELPIDWQSIKLTI
ncbi:uncharacterized protein [Watersipora subatra]|uniref:uncharacterized protein isoform X2 n=1 Tax=Watersipora subatra TaxID=2589382 RepID=UPI00355B1FF9